MTFEQKVDTIKQLQMVNVSKMLFEELIAPTYFNSDGSIKPEYLHKIVGYSAIFVGWNPGNTVKKHGLVQYGVDENGYVKLYQSSVTSVLQANILPGTPEGDHIYTLVGYIDGVRVWTQPFSSIDSYALDEIVPHLVNTEYNDVVSFSLSSTLTKDQVVMYADKFYKVLPDQINLPNYTTPGLDSTIYEVVPTVEFVNGTVLYKDEIFMYGDKYYKVIPTQITAADNYVVPGTNDSIYLEIASINFTFNTLMYKDDMFIYEDVLYKVVPTQLQVSSYTVPGTDSSIYEEIPHDYYEMIDASSVIIRKYYNFKSLKDDNRFEPSPTSPVWELVE